MPAMQQPAPTGKKSLWSKVIPRTNWVFMIISLLLVFGLDLVIVFSDTSLMSFWIAMLVVLGVFAIFFVLENYRFRKRFTNTRSAIDPWIVAVIIIRNIVFVLNFIPLIQVIGLALLGGFLRNITGLNIFSSLKDIVGGLNRFSSLGSGVLTMIMPTLLLLYVALIMFRSQATKKAAV